MGLLDVSYERLQRRSQTLFKTDWPQGLRQATGINSDPGGILGNIASLFETSSPSFNIAHTDLEGHEELLYNLLEQHALLLTGNSGSYCSTPDALALDITGDIDMRVEFLSTAASGAITDAASGNRVLMGKWTESGNQRSYLMYFGWFANPFAAFAWSNDGIVDTLNQTGDPASVPTMRAMRVNFTVANRQATFLHAPDLDGTWTQFAQSATGAATSIFAGTAPLTLGALNAGVGSRFNGRITRAQLRNGIGGTLVANPDFRNLASGTTSFTDSTGLLWTVNGDAKIL